MKFIRDWIKGAVATVIALFGAFKFGDERRKRKHTEKERDEANENAQEHANTAGATVSDAIKQLRNRAKTKLKKYYEFWK